MNSRCLINLFTFVTLSLSQPILAQSLTGSDAQTILLENPSLLENPLLLESLINQNTGNEITNDIDKSFSSKGQKLTRTEQANQLNLTDTKTLNTINPQSISIRYFKALTGQNLNIYGANEFNLHEDNSLLFYNTTGRDYVLGPGDIIHVSTTGLNSFTKEYQVFKDGTISVENLRPLSVANLTINQVNNLLLDKILMDDASAEVFVRLKNARLVTVKISGNVDSPRTIAVPAYTPLSRVIAYSGGISATGSLRNIALSQVGLATETIDFYDFLQNPSPTNDPLIKNSARVFVPYTGPTIAVTGFVNNPGIYELPYNKFEISTKDLLNITGTSFLPNGARLKISYFDANGQIATRLAAKSDLIKEGESLQVDFIETRDLNISKVSGAVLKNYEIKTNLPLSIKEVLKGGSVLNFDAHYQFALIEGKEVRAINLRYALEDEDIKLPVGSDLRILNRREYLQLVAENPNISLNPLAAKLTKAENIAEIYLNGTRIAYIPVGQDKQLYESIKDFYNPGPKTVYDVALIDSNTGVLAFDLKETINEQFDRELNSGDKLFIFEDKFYDDLILSILSPDQPDLQVSVSEVSDASVESILLQRELEKEKNEYLEAISYSQKMFQQANLINIKLDGQLFTYLPYVKGLSSSYVMKKLRNRFPKLVSEFAVVQNINMGKAPVIKNLNYPFIIKQGEEINFISSKSYRLAIKSYDALIETNLLSELKASNAVKVYYDGNLVLLLPPDYKPSELNLFEMYSKNSDLYKLYVGVKTINLENGTWDLSTFGSEEFFSDSNNLILGASNVVHLFSNNFIRSNFIDDKLNINGVNFNINSNSDSDITSKVTNQNIIANTPTALISNNNLKEVPISNEISSNMGGLLNSHIKIMENSLRTITGSVQFPGSYPVAKNIRLSNFLSTAGLIEQTAKSDIIITEAINQKDRLSIVNPKIIKLSDKNLNKVKLSGIYYLEVPVAVNDAITGTIELKGEVLVPGRYSFTRSETLQDIIKRAGGLSDVAFPLGVKLERESAKVLEKESNNILADQLEASILNLAQSSLEGAGDQVQVVLGYAAQLRNQPTKGRVALNITEDNPSNPIFLEDGDKLTVPKRPSHVSIVGSVQRSTIATYVQGQSYSDYVQAAGGLTKIADSRKAYLLLPNGQSRQLNKSTIVPVGSTIIVPPKLDRLSILGGTDIISKVLGNITDSILSIQNVD